MIVVLGVDSHKRTHTIVAVDTLGRQLATLTVTANIQGHLRALAWAARFEQRRWAVEDCRHVTRRLETDLLCAGEHVIRVPAQLTATGRVTVRTPGKSDPIDALAVARAVLREPDLAVAHLDETTREIRLLVDHRERIVRERTADQNRLRWFLHELDPDYQPASLSRLRTLSRVHAWLATHDSLVAELATELVERIRHATIRATQLETDITRRVEQHTPSLLDIPGCGALTAAKLIGETGDPTRFRNKDAFAMFTGTAPIPIWSGSERYRLNRGGNRQLNAAIHRIAITQTRCHPDAQHFITRHTTNGNTKREATRALKRKLANVIYRTLLTNTHTTQQPAQPHAA